MKQLTLTNWHETDSAISELVIRTAEGFRPMTGDDVAAAVLEIEITGKHHIPDGPRELLLSAQAVMVYGALYYPLLAVGMELCGRAAEAAIREKAVQVNIPLTFTTSRGKEKNRDFSALIDMLASQGHLQEKDWWHNIRGIRNQASHPKQQMILTLGIAIPAFSSVTARIDKLFTP